ncbi:MAG: hypothetical protein NZ954_02310 [Thermofilaceae archaeon]|nr:hypothetical protein [Thermofilaceae archaeon]MCX8181274.1 hypothetical protein [Thermofilaceae archaeon]MDW8003507.1 hypothetical protein [Thermofilaceae archaeon]
MVKVVKSSDSIVTLSVDLRRGLGVKEGVFLLVTVERVKIILKPLDEGDPIEKYSTTLPQDVEENEVLQVSSRELVENLNIKEDRVADSA